MNTVKGAFLFIQLYKLLLRILSAIHHSNNQVVEFICLSSLYNL